MKVLVLSHMYPNKMFPTYGIFVHEQVKALKSVGCEIRVVSPVQWTPFPLDYFIRKWRRYKNISFYENIEGVDVYHPKKITFPKELFLSYSGYLYYFAIQTLVREIYKKFKFDLIHAHVALPDGFSAVLLKKEYNVPLITTIHGYDLQHTIYKNKNCLNAVLKVIEESDKITVVSKKLENIANKLYTDVNNKIITINNGFSNKKVFCGYSNLKDKYADKLVFLSVGNLIKTKGHDITLEAMVRLIRKVPNAHLIIIGDGAQKWELQNLTRKLGISNNVEYLGQLSHEKVMEYMSICDIFILPSWNEAFGVVYAEAMAHAKPVIACKGEGIDGIVKDRHNGILVEPRSVDSLYEAIDTLAYNISLRTLFGERAGISIKDFTWEANALKYLYIYKDVLNISYT